LSQITDVEPDPMRHARGVEAPLPDPLLDPRWGDVGDDTPSPGQRSLRAIAGTLLVEISLPKLLFAGTVSLLLPAVLLGTNALGIVSVEQARRLGGGRRSIRRRDGSSRCTTT
jgi:hypothetical protein